MPPDSWPCTATAWRSPIILELFPQAAIFGLRTTRRPLEPIRHRLCRGYVASRTATPWYEELVDFIHCSIGCSDQKGYNSPAQTPTLASSAPRTEYQNAERAEFEDVRQLAYSPMKTAEEMGRSNWK